MDKEGFQMERLGKPNSRHLLYFDSPLCKILPTLNLNKAVLLSYVFNGNTDKLVTVS